MIGDKKYISSKQAAEILGYTQDYIGQLARGGKISAERVSGTWYVNEDDISRLSKKTNGKEKTIVDLHNPNRNEIANETNVQEKFNTKRNKNIITLDKVNYISSKRAAEIMGYTQDYIGQLARNGKIEARQVGRVWYVPETVVYKGINKTNDSEQDTPLNKVNLTNKIHTYEDISKDKSFGDMVEFKKEKEDIEIPIGLGGFQKEIQINENKQPEVESIDEISANKKPEIKESEAPLEAGAESSVGSNGEIEKNSYFYPSFLNASYSVDDTPLIPAPYRSREPVLHQIVTEEKKDSLNNNVAIRRIPDSIFTTQRNQRLKEPTHDSKRMQSITNDILKPQKQEVHSLAIKSPLSLMKIASLSVAMLLLASMVTFIPNVSVFSANTGVLKPVYSLKLPHKDTLKAEVSTSISKTSLLETFVEAFNSLFEDKIEYKSK